jgi:hypothetical protein
MESQFHWLAEIQDKVHGFTHKNPCNQIIVSNSSKNKDEALKYRIHVESNIFVLVNKFS